MPRFTHDGISHYYTVAGRGFPLVFVHGLGLSHQGWIGQMPIFTKHYQVIAYDCRGHGGTGCSTGPIEIRDLSEDLHALLQHLGLEKAVLVGYSSGTLICESFALDHPKQVAGLCLIGCYTKVQGLSMTMKTYLAKWAIQAQLHKVSAYSTAATNAENLVQRGFFYRIAKRVNPDEAVRIIEATERFVGTEDLKRLRCPILLVHGTRDSATAEYCRQLVSLLPKAEVAVVEGANHAVATRATSAFNMLLSEWLEKLPLQTCAPTEQQQQQDGNVIE